MIVVLMGVSGSGKTTIGAALAAALGWPFIEGDDLHPPANVEKMRAGIPLTDEDRGPWLDRIVEVLREVTAREGNAVLACSALRQRYRDRLAQAGDVRFVHLTGRPEVIAARLAARRHRYMPASLLASQLATLEVPGDAIDVDVEASVGDQVRAIVEALRGGTASPIAAGEA
jgi:gluconokinase